MNFVCACGSEWVVERFRVAGMHLLDVTQDVSVGRYLGTAARAVRLSALVFTTFNLQPQRQTATPSPIPERPMSLQHSGDMTPKRSL